MLKTVRLLMMWITLACGATGGAAVRVDKVPEDGVQPEVAVAPDGVVHLVYLRGEPGASEVRYTSRRSGEAWRPSRTVNSAGHRAVAMGGIRGAQLALGKAGTVHVLWNGASEGAGEGSPLWYTRMTAGSGAFEPERPLLGGTTALDGGASVAADANGRVIVAWHAGEAGRDPEEAGRLVWVRTSETDGSTFTEAEAINRDAPGVCACCSLRAGVDEAGAFRVFVRTVRGSDHRAMTLFSHTRQGWPSREIENWPIAACPMSSAALATVADRVLGVWETAGAIRAGWMSDPAMTALTVAARDARHPAVARNSRGSVVIAWSEGTGWNRGGAAGWQELDANLRPAGDAGRTPGVPVWGRVAVYAEPDGGFVLLR